MPKINHAEILSIVPPDDGNFKAALKDASPEDLFKAIAERRSQGHKSGLKALEAELDRRFKSAGPTEATLEVVGNGEATGQLDAALKKMGHPGQRDLLNAGMEADMQLLAKSGREWICAVLRIGLRLWAMKKALRHGKFRAYVEALAKQYGFKSDTQLRLYLALAKRLLLEVEQPDARSTIGLASQNLPAEGRTALLSLNVDSTAGQDALARMIGDVRSLSELESHFLAARKLAEKEAKEDARQAAKQKAEEGEESGSEEGDQPPAAPGKPEQTDFFGKLFARPFRDIEVNLTDKIGDMSDDDLLRTEQAILDALKIVKAKADDIRKRQADAKDAATASKRRRLTGAE